MVKDQRVSTEISRASSPQPVYETLCPHSSRAMPAFNSYSFARYSTPTRVVKLLAVSKKFLHKYPSPRPRLSLFFSSCGGATTNPNTIPRVAWIILFSIISKCRLAPQRKGIATLILTSPIPCLSRSSLVRCPCG